MFVVCHVESELDLGEVTLHTSHADAVSRVIAFLVANGVTDYTREEVSAFDGYASDDWSIQIGKVTEL